MDHEIEMLAGVLDGDRDAIDAFVRKVTPVLRRRVAAVLLRQGAAHDQSALPELARDIVQDVLIALLDDRARQLRRWDPARASLATFLGRFAEWRANDHLRMLRRRPPLHGDEGVLEGVRDGGALDPERHTSARQLLDRALSAVRSTLTAHGQHLLDLIYVEGLSVTETAHATGLTEAAVYTWRTRLRRRLRTELKHAT